MIEQNKKVLSNIIAAVESGGQVYGRMNWTAYAGPGANTPNEVTCTLGPWQAYGAEAQAVIQYIFDHDRDTFSRCDKENRIKQKLQVSWVGTRWAPDADEKAVLIKLLDTEAGHRACETIFRDRLDKYLARAEAFGVTGVAGQMMWAEVQHLGGVGPVERVFTRAAGNYSLEHILSCLLPKYADPAKKAPVESNLFWTRHVKCSEMIMQHAIDAQDDSKEERKEKKSMGVTASNVIQRAQHFVGYREKNHSWANMEDFTADAGSGNYQRFQPIAGAGNGDQWCQYFVDAIMVEVTGSIAKAKQALCQTNSGNYMTGYTPDGSNYFKQAGRWYTTPEVGDVIYFYSSSMGRICHTGYVEAVDKDSKIVYTIEGNTNSDGFATNGGCVARHSYSYKAVGGGNRVAGFGRPRYDADVDTDGIFIKIGGGNMTYRLDEVKIGSKGTSVLLLQEILKARGYYKGSLDKDFGDITDKAVRAYQADRIKAGAKIGGADGKPDGVVGSGTWHDLLALAAA